ncbi:alpha/beta hydrolase [Azoarcus sp. DD4]|uniref:alpha/beta fold hydrolase n=1 Tax=Azoarcus sp. DD4 TaxID=2027405 RepID=UPI00112D2647|nr:alpha/beta hydrolase [Azoarcus sp. DD4]QDF99676.1 alpha/beta hydrolase [Azoarcus sp. DD4]
MSDPTSPNVSHHDSWVEHEHGRLFARSWTPSGGPAMAAAEAPIVLFHDSLGCVDLWRDFPARLSALTGRRVVAYDRLGFGRSDARAGQPALDFIADEAKTYFPAVRAQLGIQRFVAFGHSVGGGMAVNCAAEFAADCEALITESAQVFPEELTLRNIAAAKEQFKDTTQVQRLEKYHGDKARWVLAAWTESWLHPDFASWSLTPVLPRVSCPVLAIHGIHDEYGTTRHPEMIGELCAGPARVEIIPDTYHVPHRERPEDIAGLVSAFIASARQESGRPA